MEDKTVAAVEDVQLDILTSVVTDSFFLSQPQVVIRGTAAFGSHLHSWVSISSFLSILFE